MEVALRRVSKRYAYAVDTGDGDLLAAQLTADGAVIAARGTFQGLAQLRGIPTMGSSRYLKTFYAVLNQTAKPVDGGAKGETYFTACHYVRDPVGHFLCYEMIIR